MEKAITFPVRVLYFSFSREAYTSCETHISDFFILKIFSRQRKNIFESEESSDDEVVNFRKKVTNRTLSNSDSDIEEAYTSEDLEDMLEAFSTTVCPVIASDCY